MTFVTSAPSLGASVSDCLRELAIPSSPLHLPFYTATAAIAFPPTRSLKLHVGNSLHGAAASTTIILGTDTRIRAAAHICSSATHCARAHRPCRPHRTEISAAAAAASQKTPLRPLAPPKCHEATAIVTEKLPLDTALLMRATVGIQQNPLPTCRLGKSEQHGQARPILS
jgi:hypothetical protein